MIAPGIRASAPSASGMLQSGLSAPADQAPAGGACYRDAWPGAGSERVPLCDAGTTLRCAV
jgi:hypothetical protein